MGWTSLTLVTDAAIGRLEPEAVHPSAPWGQTSWPSQRTSAKQDLRIWLEADFADIPGVADRILDRHAPDYVFAYTGAAYSDETAEASDDQEEDLDLSAVFTTAATDRLYVGAVFEFDGLHVKLLDSLNAIASVLTVKYWGPTGWTSLTATDGTAASGKTFAKTGRITWDVPTDWERRDLNDTGEEYFWIELSVSVALTSGTSATQILPVHAPDALKRIAEYLALYHICHGLAAQSGNPELWDARAEKYLNAARSLYETLKNKGGIPIDVNTDGTIDQNERQLIRTVRLRRG
jgi:hypothetical protein